MKSTLFFFLSCVVIGTSTLWVGCNAKAATGKHVFEEQCAGCHNADSSDKKVGPGLKGLFQHETLSSNGKKVSEASVRTQIEEGGSGMPSFDQTLSDSDKESLMAYLKTL